MSDDTFGFEEFQESLDDIISNFNNAISSKLAEIADEVVADTQLNSPVLTGNLRRSWGRSGIKKEGNTYSVELGSTIDYAPHVEYGHKTKNGGFVKGRFILTNAIKKAEKKIPTEWDYTIGEITKELKL